MKLDLNCDLGEGEPAARTRALLRQVTSANIACGGHAGDAVTMEHCVRLALALGVRIGAHPGLPGGFGRGEVTLTANELRTLILQQTSALRRLAEVHRARLHHIKLHGSLYHAVERDVVLGRAYMECVGRWFGGVRVYALAGGRIADWGQRLGMEVWEEAFADRAYHPDGSLVPRGNPGAVLTDLKAVIGRLNQLRLHGGWPAADGTLLRLKPRTVCIHGDTPGSVRLARAVRASLRKAAPDSTAR